MEGHIQTSPTQECSIDNIDAKDISELSTILVATIQEAKGRISQIEYIFCSQIYPKVQAKSKNLNRIHAEAMKAAEEEWRERENDLLLEVKRLKLEKQQADEEKWSVKSEKGKVLKENEAKLSELRWKVSSQQRKINELEKKIVWKSEEVDEAMKMKHGLIEMYQSKARDYLIMWNKLEEEEKKTKALTAELNSQKKKVDEHQQELSKKDEELRQELGKKDEEVARTKELTENLKKKIEMLISNTVNNKKQLMDQNEDNKLLHAKLEGLEENVSRLQAEVRKKTEEVEEGRKLQEQLLQQINLSSSKMLENKQEYEKEKQLLLDKVKGLEVKVNKLKINLSERSGDGAGGKDFNDNLLQEIELKTSEFMAEKKKRRDVVDAYKRLKSQYIYICTKFGLTTDNMLPQNKLDEESDSLRHRGTLSDHEVKNSAVSEVDCETNKVKHETDFSDTLHNEKGAKPIQTSNFHSPPPKFIIAPNCPSNVKSAPVAGTKRPASSWRNTRSHQCQGGPDPHDDFLDTPFENIRGNLKKAVKEEVSDLPIQVAKDMNLDSSDEETQDMNIDDGTQIKQDPNPVAGKQGFKYVEPVRRKAERENLKGIECKQCKKFYDAVLPDEGGMEGDGGKRTFHCEHHDGVSRHRYKYVPPMTPEGFWNIGFESEL